MGKKLLFIVVALLVASSLILAACRPAAKPEKVWELTYCSHQPSTSGYALSAQAFFNELEKRTNGIVKVTNWGFFEAIVKAPEQVEATSKGMCDASFMASGYCPSELPLTFFASYPYLAGTDGSANALALHELYETWAPMRHEYDRQNLVPIYFGPAPLLYIAINKDISKAEDLLELKLHGYGAVAAAFDRAGISAVSMSSAEVYEAISRGTIDGSGRPMEWLHAANLAEVFKTLVDPKYGGFGTAGSVMNKTLYDSFPEWIQDEIKSIRWGGPNISEVVWMAVQAFSEQESLTVEDLREYKIKKYEFTPEEAKWFRDSIKPEEMWAEYIEKYKDVEGIDEFVDRFLPLLEKYKGAFPVESAWDSWEPTA